MPTDEQLATMVKDAENAVARVKDHSILGVWLYRGDGKALLDVLQYAKDLVRQRGSGQ